MNLSYIRYFVELAHVQHYTNAARNLNITQPSLSHAISQLEEELGVMLFEKNGRNTELTAFGREFLACAERSLGTLDAGVESIQKEAAGDGVIRLGLIRPLGMEFVPRLAAEYLKKCGNRNVSFTFHTGTTGQLLDDLAARKYDMVFCSRPPETMGFSAVPVGRQDLVVIAPSGHPLADRDSVTLEDTLGYKHVYFSKGSGMRSLVDEMFEGLGKAPEIACETEEDEVIAGLVAAGFGIAVVPYMDMLKRLDVKVLSIKHQPVDRLYYVVHDSRTYMSPAATKFHKYVLSCN